MNLRHILWRERLVLALGAALVVAIGVGVAVAIPDPSGVIQGCYNNRNGKLRAVEDPSECSSRETPIFWNQEGPPGTQGVQGEQGVPGVLDFYIRTAEQSFTPDSTFQFNLEAHCDPGDKVTGGGVQSTGFTEVEEYYDFPLFDLGGWIVQGLYTGDAPVTVTVHAVCADLPDLPPE